MKTNETSTAVAQAQPGNLSVRQLAKSLTTTAAAKTTENGNSDNGAAASREEPPPTGKLNEENPNAGSESENLSAEEQTEGTETASAETTAEAENTEPTEATEPENTEAETAENAESAETKGTLPEELRDAMELARGDGKKGIAKLLDRVHRLVDDRDQARNARLQTDEQNAQLRRELQEARSQKPEGGNGGAPQGVHPEVARVTEELAQADHWLSWCEAHPEGGEVPDGKGGKIELNDQQVRALRTDLDRNRQEIVARKVQTQRDVTAEYQRQFNEHHTVALAEYPWLKNSNAPEHQEMQAIVKFFPQVKASPDFELAIGDLLAGKAARLARAKAKTNGNGVHRRPAPQREPTRVNAEAPVTSAARKSPEKAKQDEADNQFRKTGSVKDLAKSFAASRRASRAG